VQRVHVRRADAVDDAEQPVVALLLRHLKPGEGQCYGHYFRRFSVMTSFCLEYVSSILRQKSPFVRGIF
jgi:hypothetical protein